MYEELSLWRDYIDLMMQLAIEMESHEQIPGNISDTIAHLFNSVGEDENYSVDFEHPDDRGRKVVFEFRAYEKSEE